MSDQKYYVKSKFWNGGQNYFTLDKSIITDSFWSRWINPKTFEAPQQQFTKQELAGIMGDAIYSHECRITSYMSNQIADEKYNSACAYCSEWINPLIEIVPVEEEV